MPLQATSGAASYDAFGGGVAAVPNYIEEVFQTWLYTGTGTTAGSTQTITNGIDLSGKGGMVWIKDRGVKDHFLFDTNRGIWKYLKSNSTDAQPGVNEDALSAFNSNGFTLTGDNNVTQNGQTYASWTFRKQPKFFDCVTYTGNSTVRTIAHNLGSVPGCVMIKCSSNSGDWVVWHRSSAAANAGNVLKLNTTNAEQNTSTVFNSTSPTSTVFTVGTSGDSNANGATYVAYIFAHDAGGFGLTGTDNVISCGSYTGNGSATGPIVTLGYEPQWLLIKRSDVGGTDWRMFDNMRGLTMGVDGLLRANTSEAEEGNVNLINPLATGFQPTTSNSSLNASGSTYIYIAIRRGPMKVPTTGTSVFVPYAYAGSGAGTYTTGINQDAFFAKSRGSSSYVWNWYDRLRGPNLRLQSNATNAEASATGVTAFNNTSMVFGASDGFSSASPFGGPYIGYALTRAPGYFDEVCYTGTGSARTVAHNLAAVPELMIVKRRTGDPGNWAVYHIGADLSTPQNKYLYLNSTDAVADATVWNDTAPTASQFTVGGFEFVNASGANFVAYLFATCPGVSKVGSYTGNGSSQTINCGFTGGARFVMIKRTDSTGDWYVWDTARGIVSGNDPHLSLNTTAAEVTSNDTIDTDSTGFVVNQVSATNVNVSSATYIFMSVA
jgi:hypothetical protein